MRRLAARFIRCRGGSAAVEFAMLALPFFVLVAGTVEAGRAYWTAQAIGDVATDAARCVAVGGPACSDGGAFSAARAAAYAEGVARQYGIRLEPGSVSVSPSDRCGGEEGFVSVSVTHSFASPAAPLLEAFSGSPMTARSCFPHLS